MSGEYQRPAAAGGGLRLHLNENTAGCSPAVLETLRAMTRVDVAFYPDYDAAQHAVATHFDVEPDAVLLTNGLDEGILAVTAAAFRDRSRGVPDAVGVLPAFDMYEVCTEALGGRLITVPLGARFEFSFHEIARARTPATRIVFLTNPHNPTGQILPLDPLRNLVRDLAPVILFVDEAYADFSGETLLDRGTLDRYRNLVIGRTFAKAYGLAALRAGALIAHPDTLAPIRRIVPPYSLNAWAAAALPVALNDRAYRDWYIAQAAESRDLLTKECVRLGLRTWPSAANFMLVHVGEKAPALTAALAARGIYVRDRSSEAGCQGCIRITTGVVEHTRQLIAALEEELCAKPR
ncbi:MAG: histidinol-phosphate transaminase [Acidobacteria bacterium]|nr:MAG: histidinol-phosphate transaminase [Acidobacteriota bacterium]